MKRLSRLTALLLAIMLTLSMIPAALAEEVMTMADYNDDAYAALYNKLMACETYEECETVLSETSMEDYEAFYASLTEEQASALDSRMSALLMEMIGVPARNVTNAGPLMDPVYIPVISRMATFALSDEGTTADNGISLSKKAEVVDDGYKITLEAYTTGTVTKSEEVTPCDIILVLDESGSMDYSIGKNPVYADELDTSKTYYIMTGNSARRVFYNDWDGSWYSYYSKVTPKTSATDTTDGRVQFYETYQTRNAALIEAVNVFLGNVRTAEKTFQATNTTNAVGYRVGIIGFSSSDRTVRGLGTNLTNVTTLNSNGGTYIDGGLDRAIDMLDGTEIAGQERNRVVIAFTDGNPGTGDWDDDASENCAAAAINYANTLKKPVANNGYGVTFYSIGIFSGANPSDTTGLSNQYMNAMSSNYPNATANSTGNNYSVTLGTRSTTGNYYLAASDTTALTKIFESISTQIGKPTTTLTTETVVKDIIAPSFTLPDGATITLQTSARTADGGWAEPVDAPSTVTAEEKDSVVTIKGFDFSKNFVAANGRDENDASKEGTFYGRKLIISFTVKLKDGFLGGNGVPTNGPASGLYETGSSEEALELFEVPTIDVPVKPLVVTAAEKNVYLLDAPTEAELLVDAKVEAVDVYGNKYDINSLADWQKEFVVIGDPTATVDKETTMPMVEDGQYTVSASINVGTDDSTKQTTTSVPAKINVFKPVLTFRDSVVDYLQEGIGAEYYQVNNDGGIVWMHGNVASTTVTMTGREPGSEGGPTLNVTYMPAVSSWAPGGVVTAMKDVPVNVSVAIDDTAVAEADLTFVHAQCNCTLDAGKSCGWTAQAGEFIVHVKNIVADLTITKTDLNEYAYKDGTDRESAIFTVTATDKTGKVQTWIIVLAEGESVTIKDLKVNAQYSIAEQNAWTWRYKDMAEVKGTITRDENGNGVTVTIENKADNPYWLGGDNYATNVFGASN